MEKIHTARENYGGKISTGQTKQFLIRYAMVAQSEQWWNTCVITIIWRYRQANLIEVQTSVVYKASFTTVKNTGNSMKTLYLKTKKRKLRGLK